VNPEETRAEAGRLFEAAGFTGGEVLKLDILPERLDAPAVAQLLQQEVAAFGIETEITPREYTEMITLQTTGTFNHMIVGFGNWVKPGSTAVTVLFADAYDGRMNAPADENVPLLERPGIADEPEWTDMIQQAIDGTWTDWRAWNEKYLDVAWANLLFRQYSLAFTRSSMALDRPRDSFANPYHPGMHLTA
jgi:ABC-type transport system substrate-binding protein